MDLRGTRFLVVGLGKSGVAAAKLLCARGARVVAADLRDEDALGAAATEVRAAGAELALGEHEPALFQSVDHIVVSPGVPRVPALASAEAAGIPVSSEVELASWFIEGTLVGITGTNGKSTVTTLVGDMCRRAGRPTFVGGNLGTPLVDAVGSEAAGSSGFVVVELSSFQLERVRALRVNVAGLLNVSPDHLDRYDSLEAYAEAKAAIFAGQQAEDAAVVPADDTLCRRLAARSLACQHEFGGTSGEVRVEGEHLVDPHCGLRVATAELGLSGVHNLANCCAAALVARLAGVPVEHIGQALREFRGLPHRMAAVRDVAGVLYVDDSKATNVGATAAALQGLATAGRRVVLIAGGKDKGGDYDPLRRQLQRCGRGAVLIGEAAELMRRELQGAGCPLAQAGSMVQAVQHAQQLARPGDVVLLSPACSSFDMFRSYVHRGEAFQQAVASLSGGTS